MIEANYPLRIEQSGGQQIHALPAEALTFQSGGDPLTRVPQRVAEDVLDDRITQDHARQAYGVVLTGDTIDWAATERLRASMEC